MEYIKKGQIGTNFSEELTKSKYQFQFSASAEKLASLKNSWDKAKVFNWEDFLPENIAKDLHTYYFHNSLNICGLRFCIFYLKFLDLSLV